MMKDALDLPAPHADALTAAAEAAGRAVPPAWPLDATVAVNPFLGQTGERLAAAGARLARAAGIAVTPERARRLGQIARGEITRDDLAAALAASPWPGKPADVAALEAAAASAPRRTKPLPTIAEMAADHSGLDWPGLIADRLGQWAGGYFDAGQALWQAPRRRGPYAEWRAAAIHDLTPEIHGLTGFAAHVAEAPETAQGQLARAADRLGLAPGMLESCFHRLLTTWAGWGQYARRQAWEAEQTGAADPVMTELLAIRLIWEEALLDRYEADIADRWERIKRSHAEAPAPSAEDVVDEILQEAAERAAQRALAGTLGAPDAAPGAETRPEMQAAFCIDVRSEVFRRALESAGPEVRTLGFAGFFGLPVSHQGFASDAAEARLPVLLQPALTSRAGGPEAAGADRAARIAARASRAWGRFKLAAVSSFAFVEATGPLYAAKLVQDALGRKGGKAAAEPAPRLDPAPPLEARIEAAERVLGAMSLTRDFARLVVIAGHGAEMVNNPHASAYRCGACGGHSGEVNARLLAALLNDAEVRAGLAERGLEIPADTLFVAALHDTVSDTVALYEGDADVSAHRDDLKRARARLAEAGRLARAERAGRLPRAEAGADLPARARDWAEIRPEWGLAGCRAFIAAPRARSRGRDLSGRAFLHDYDWRRDPDFAVLELILTAPVVVASWISLQYYGSAVAPETFGAGDKLLHNVVGGVGVVEGHGGLMRAGLPWQAVHDGEDLVHEPLRLTVCVEAPREAICDILDRHPEVRALFDNRWLHLLALDESGRPAWRYAGDLEWREEPAEPAAA